MSDEIENEWEKVVTPNDQTALFFFYNFGLVSDFYYYFKITNNSIKNLRRYFK